MVEKNLEFEIKPLGGSLVSAVGGAGLGAFDVRVVLRLKSFPLVGGPLDCFERERLAWALSRLISLAASVYQNLQLNPCEP